MSKSFGLLGSYLECVLFILLSLSSASPSCSSRFGSTLRTSDCDSAIYYAIDINTFLPAGVFTADALDRNFHLPFHSESPNDACHFGVDFGGGHEIAVYADWYDIIIAGYAILNRCVDRSDGSGWGGWIAVGRTNELNVTLWQEEEVQPFMPSSRTCTCTSRSIRG